MNKPVVTKAELIDVAEKILVRDGLEKLNIRRLAKECNISVGCMYNYFPSKAELIFAVIERFWDTVIHKSAFHKVHANSFIEMVDEIYSRLLIGLEGFSSEFLSQISVLSLQDRKKGKKMESEYFDRMKKAMIQVINQDEGISPAVWTETFTKIALIEFVFRNILTSLRIGDLNCSMLIELVEHKIYQ